MADLPERDATGALAFDQKVTDPESDEAVQVPPEADGTKQNVEDVYDEPTPEEVFARAAKSSSRKSSSDES